MLEAVFDSRPRARLSEVSIRMSAMNEKDYYAILGVSKDADKKEIQKAFQQKARKLHPDVNKASDAEDRFKEVSEAYAVLSDDQKRARYDAMRSGNPFAGTGQTAPSSSPYGGGYSGYPGGWSPFGFPFDMAGAGRRRPASAYNPEEGANVVVEVTLNAEQARNGLKTAVKYRRYEPCSHCHGSGSVAAEHARTCPTCGGSGAIDVDMSSLFGMGRVQMVCPECGGSGKVVADPCPDCGGTGRTPVMSEAVIQFPAGTHDGDAVRLPGLGHAGTNGAAAGDLVGRAKVAAERLEGRARTGFYVVGFALPFLVLAALMGVFSIFALICIGAVVCGTAMVVSDGVLRRSSRWWRNGALVLANGAANSLFMALVLVWFVSCSQRAMLIPYGY